MPTNRSSHSRRQSGRASERGAAALEFALVLPLLVMLVFGIITFGRAYQAKVELASGVREGARALALGKSSGDAKAATIDAAPGLSPALTAGDISTTACPSGGADGTARVSASWQLTYTIPLVSSGTVTINADGAMRCGV
jgi:Flp pilus assembly protein TadG